jgi:hypothetical protein
MYLVLKHAILILFAYSNENGDKKPKPYGIAEMDAKEKGGSECGSHM